MHVDKPLRELGAWLPSPAEILQAEYVEWDISREVDPAGRHSDWVARYSTERDRVHRAADIPSLSALLAKDSVESEGLPPR
ncbi:hypothetical protein [Nonomuraea longicatena]|uniref:Uncharacterized protein n=1 Tax=Nonomuraea longicatena TaxID=83682 RepID=A0ABN1PX75_9ACTN